MRSWWLAAALAACGATPSKSVPPVTGEAPPDDGSGPYLRVERGRGPACEAWRAETGFLVRARGRVNEVLDLAHGRIVDLRHDFPGDLVAWAEHNNCDAEVNLYATAELCAAGTAVTDLRACLGRPLPIDDATFSAFEQLLAGGGAMWSADGAACIRWDVAPEATDDGELAGTITQAGPAATRTWEYWHEPDVGDVVFDDEEDEYPDGTVGQTVATACDHSSAIHTPAPGVIELAGRFFLDPAACAADTARVPGALDPC